MAIFKKIDIKLLKNLNVVKMFKFSIIPSKHTHLEVVIIQIESFELLRILNVLKFIIILSKHTLNSPQYKGHHP
jgi:hypothetical protein